MCMEDIRAGRRANGKISSVAVGVGGNLVASASPKRIAIEIWPANAGRITIATDAIPAVDAGVTFVRESGPVSFNIQEHGNLVMKAFFGIAAAAGSTCGLVETFLDEV